VLRSSFADKKCPSIQTKHIILCVLTQSVLIRDVRYSATKQHRCRGDIAERTWSPPANTPRSLLTASPWRLLKHFSQPRRRSRGRGHVLLWYIRAKYSLQHITIVFRQQSDSGLLQSSRVQAVRPFGMSDEDRGQCSY
jgi:hypothetical protein